MPTIQDALSELLDALGFKTMAREVKAETDKQRLSRYARVIIKNTPEGDIKRRLWRQLKLAGLL